MFEFFITKPLGFIIQLIYNLVQNYGLAIILFTAVIKLILLPLQIKSQKSMKKQQMIQPIIAQLQQKYANDKEKLQTEMMKVYKENNVSMAGGCLPTLIQFPILIGLYQVIQKPLSYLINLDFSAPDVIEKIHSVVQRMVEVGAKSSVGNLADMAAGELAKNIQKVNQIPFLTWTRYLSEEFGEFSEWVLNFNFLGLDLSKKPSSGFATLLSGNFDNLSTILLLLVPAVAIFATWFSLRQTQKQSGQAPPKDSNGNEMANSMTKSMTLVMPIMTGVFTFTLPAAMGIYWIASSAMQIVTQYILNAYFNKREDDFIVKVPEKNGNKRKKRG